MNLELYDNQLTSVPTVLNQRVPNTRLETNPLKTAAGLNLYSHVAIIECALSVAESIILLNFDASDLYRQEHRSLELDL